MRCRRKPRRNLRWAGPSVLLLSSILQAKHTGRRRGKLFTKSNEEAWQNRSDTTKAAMPSAANKKADEKSAALRFAKRLIHCSYAVFALQLHFWRVIRGNFLSDIVLGGIELPWRLRHRKLLQMTDPALHAFRDRMDTSLIDIVGSFLAR